MYIALRAWAYFPAMWTICGSAASIRSSSAGIPRSSSAIRRWESTSSSPRLSARWSARSRPHAIWATKVLVAATPISGPACMWITPSASRESALPTTLVMATTVAPLRRASRTAARVSAVSPDWLMATTRVRSSTRGSR